jgi:hypothetical protein
MKIAKLGASLLFSTRSPAIFRAARLWLGIGTCPVLLPVRLYHLHELYPSEQVLSQLFPREVTQEKIQLIQLAAHLHLFLCLTQQRN